MTKIYEIGSCEWLEIHKNDPGIASIYAKEIQKCKEIADAKARRREANRAEQRRGQLGNISRAARPDGVDGEADKVTSKGKMM